MSFVHLHVHSHMSFLDSTIRIPDLVQRVKALGMSAVALTDHNNLFGAVQFLKCCKANDIKPIFGAEVLLPDARQGGRNFHLLLLCRNAEGMANLRALITHSYVEGLTHGVPLISREMLTSHTAGLIGLSACLGGEVSQALLRGDRAAAEAAAAWYAERFAPDAFFLELQANELVEQAASNEALIDLGHQMGLPLVATNNAHYLERDDAVAHAVLVAINLKRTLDQARRNALPLRSFHLATPDEMKQAFAHIPEALDNTGRIADMVEGVALETTKKLHFPCFEPPEGRTTPEYLRELTATSLDQRLEQMVRRGETPDREAYEARAAKELDVICTLGFDAYYLIVWDFINWAKSNGVPVGPGRGSGAGSLVAFAIGITDIDPIRYSLLFERFLNPERVSPPDFDVDFCMDNRDRVYQYVIEKYGRDKVGQIITFNAMKARAAIRDVARVMGLPFSDGDRVAKLIPTDLDITLGKALAREPRLADLIKSDPVMAELWRVAEKLEGLNRQAGKHAAGVVIADRPIADYAPLFVADDGSVVTQFNMGDLDAVGLIKFDFLGLTSLTTIARAEELIRARANPNFRLEDIPLDDAATYEMVAAGRTAGVFQLETRGITDLVRRLRPSHIEDIIAVIALFRPGPLGSGMVDSFVRRKHGQEEVTYLVPQLESLLKDTYGVILYQEQVMLIAANLGGFSLGQADLLRRAMGKKKMDELQRMRQPFLDGAEARGIPRAKANEVYELMIPFAEYGFNKSHSAAYAIVGYRMAYMKAHYPTQFLCALLSVEKSNQTKVMRFIREARSCGIPVLSPDVNRSGLDFTVEEVTNADGTLREAIRFGLGAVKGVGTASVEAIVAARTSGPFLSVVDYMARVDGRKVNRRVHEALIKGGAMDGFGHSRAALMQVLDRLIEAAQSKKAEKESGQISLFDGSGEPEYRVPDLAEWPNRQRLSFEREAIGYYVSGHPLDPYTEELRRFKVSDLSDAAEAGHGTDVTVAGIVAACTEKVTKGGQSRMAFITLEDTTGQIECVVFPKAYEQWAALAGADEPLMVQGTVQQEGDADAETVRLHVKTIERLDVARKGLCKNVFVTLDLGAIKDSDVDRVRDVALRHRGACGLNLLVRLAGAGEILLRADSRWRVSPSPELVADLEALLGPNTVTLGS